MKRLLQISIVTRTWTEGNHVWFDARLKPGTEIEVHWGDGSHSVLRHNPNYGMCRVAHYYKSAERKSLPYQIEFLSEDADALEVLIDGAWETKVENVVFENCPALNHLQFTQLYNVDFSGCPNVETLVTTEYYGDRLDVAPMSHLKKLICRQSRNLRKLDLTNNDELEQLDISMCDKLRSVILTNNSRLKIVAIDEFTHLEHHSNDWLRIIAERNGGCVEDDWLDAEFYSNGCFGEEI